MGLRTFLTRTLILLLLAFSCPILATAAPVPRETIERLAQLNVERGEVQHLNAIGKLTDQEYNARNKIIDQEKTRLWELHYLPTQITREETAQAESAIAGLTTVKLSLLRTQWTKEEAEYSRAAGKKREDDTRDIVKNAQQAGGIQRQRHDLQEQLDKGTIDRAAFDAKDREAVAAIEALRNKHTGIRQGLFFDERLSFYTSRAMEPPKPSAPVVKPPPVVRYQPPRPPPPPDFTLWIYALGGGGLIIVVFWLASLGKKQQGETGPTPTGIHGTAKWHDLEYTAAKDTISRGVHFGRSSQPGFNHQQATAPITSKPESHVLVTAATGSGKGTKVIFPTLFRYASSMLVIDPKGELTAVSGRTRRDQLHQDIQILNPWGVLQDTYTKLGFTTATYNPLDALDRNDPNITSLAKTLSGMICPVTDPKNEFWQGMAARTLTAIFLWLTDRDQLGEEKTFTRVAEIVNLPKPEFQELLTKMRASKAFNGDLRNMVGQMADSSAADTYGGIMLNLQQRLDFVDTALKISMQTSSVSLEKLAEGTMTAYLVIPFDYIQTHGTWLRMLILAATQAIMRARQKKPAKKRCMFLIDEFGSIGYIPSIAKNLAQMRGYGIDFTLILQDFNQLKDHYKDAKDSIIGNCAYKYFSSVADLQTAKELSESIGKKTVITVSTSKSSGTTDKGSSQGEGVSYSETGRSLLNPDEIMTLGKNTAILLHEGAPHYLQPVDYRNLQQAYSAFATTHPEWYWTPPLQYDPNPYHSDPTKPPIKPPNVSPAGAPDWMQEIWDASKPKPPQKPTPPPTAPPAASAPNFFDTVPKEWAKKWADQLFRDNPELFGSPEPPPKPPMIGDEVFTDEDMAENAAREAAKAKAREMAGAEKPPPFYGEEVFGPDDWLGPHPKPPDADNPKPKKPPKPK